MMSQLIISRLLKHTVCKNVLRHKNVRLFSTPAYPHLLIDYILKTAPSSECQEILKTAPSSEYKEGRFTLRSGSYYIPHLKEELIDIKDQELVDEVRHAMTLGFHNGGVRFHMSDQTSLSIHYQDPSDPKANPMSVNLPPLPTGSRIQNLAMSSRPDLDNKDWVVAVKFSGYQLRLYRPACHDDFRWIDIKTTPDSVNPFSSIMYSKKDERFYVPTPGCDYLCSLDLHFKEGDKPEFPTMWTEKQSRPRELDVLNLALRTDHLVESPSGEKFLVKWYSGDEYGDFKGMGKIVHITKRFMVFRADVGKDDDLDVAYTEDIGDLCIFLGHGEAFCVPASSSPGLRPNCIYFVGYNFGVYDISARLCTTFFADDFPLNSTEFPYWPSPIRLYS